MKKLLYNLNSYVFFLLFSTQIVTAQNNVLIPFSFAFTPSMGEQYGLDSISNNSGYKSAIVKETTNIFDSSSKLAFAIGTVNKGDKVTILQTRGDKCKIRVKNITGWIQTDYLIFPNSPDIRSVNNQRKMHNKLEVGSRLTLKKTSNAYDFPGGTYAIGSFVENESVVIREIREGWVQVESVEGRVGWVVSDGIIPIPPPIPPDPNPSFMKENKWVLLAASAISLSISAYYYSEGNTSYKEYKNAKTVERTVRLYDQTTKYDNLSSGFLIGGSALVGTYLTFVIWEF